MTEPMSAEVVAMKLDVLQRTIDEVKADVKDIKDEAPVHRIRSLEQWRRGLAAWLSAVSVALIAAVAASLIQ